jgi:pimeloyl-ACP methyl ester carboxylesterase
MESEPPMQKPRPTPDLRFVFRPETDTGYRHFDGREHAPFNAAATALTRANAWWLAESALLSYWNAADAIGRFNGAGLTAEFVEQGDTQAYVAWDQRAVLIVFRGTQPGSLGDIVDDAVVPLVPWTHGSVHLGFKNALDRVWPRLVEKLTPLASSRTVWIAGHSLGAALATLAADRFPSTAGVCTLGSPLVGDRLFAAGFDARFGARALRYVNDGDIVTHVPTPFPLPYAHVGALRQIMTDGRITQQAPSLGHVVRDIFGNIDHLREVSEGLRTGALRTAPKFLLDHMPRGYTVDMWNDFDAHGEA